MNESNRTGKYLQDLIKESAAELNLGCERFKDAGFVGDKSEQRRFTSKNVADFIVYGPETGLAFIEAKNRDSSLTFADITQEKDLLKKHEQHQERSIIQASCGVLVLFRNKNKAFWVPIQNIAILKESQLLHTFLLQREEILLMCASYICQDTDCRFDNIL